MTNLDQTISELFDAVERVQKIQPREHELSPEGQRNLEACQRIMRRMNPGRRELDYSILEKLRDESVGDWQP